MSGTSVLFDAPGPRARRLSVILSVVTGLVVAGAVAWLIVVLATPRVSGGVPVPAVLDPSRWDIFADPQVWSFIGQGVLGTLQAAAVAAVGALLLGVAFALLRSSDHAWVRVPTTIVQEFLRGMPVLLMMLFILLLAATAPFWAVVIALILYNGTLIGEALRAGLVSLPRGQREAALSIGMRSLQSRMLVEFPQAFRQMLPIIIAQLVVLLKDTSLGYIVAYNELIRTTMNNLSAFYGNRYLFSLFAVTLAIYLVINLSLSWFARRLARGTNRRASRGPDAGDVDPERAILAAQGTTDSRTTPV